MSLVSEKTRESRFYVSEDDLTALPADRPLRHDSPQNMNYMAAYAVPVVNYLKTREPHVAIGCDRAGRLFSRAVYAMWHELMDNEPFPTLDNRLHFAYISVKQANKSDANKDKMKNRVQEIIASSKEAGEKKGRTVSENEQLRILFIDDFMNEGRMRHLVGELLDGTDAQAEFAVMWNGKNETSEAEIYGNEGGLAKMGRTGLDWPHEIGVAYEDVDRPVLTPSEYSAHNFRRLGAAVKRVAEIAMTV